MKLTNVLLITILGAGSLQATIMQGSSAVNFGGISETLAAPLTPGTSVAGLSFGQTGISFSSSSSTTLYYDPNGSGQCSLGNGTNGNAATYTLASMTHCVGDYNLSQYNTAGTPLSSTDPANVTGDMRGAQTIDGNSNVPYNFTISFLHPVYNVSLVFAIAGAGSTPVFNVALNNGDSKTGFVGNGANPALQYLNITEATSFSQISFSEPSLTTYSASPNTWTVVAGNITTSSVPEPGTIGLLGLGLAGIGYIARRRKA